MKRLPAPRSLGIAAPGSTRTNAAKGLRRERGAAAVEFALVMPLLLILVLGIVEFGRFYNIQTTLSGAAREGVRAMALQNSVSGAKASTKAAASPAVVLADSEIVVSPTTCPPAGTTSPPTVTVTVTHTVPFITSFFGIAPLNLTGVGVMLCNG